MKLATLAALAALVIGHVSASPTGDVLTPSGIPATSGLPFSTLSFDTAAPSSILSALSSLISSESTAIVPFTISSRSVATSSSPSSSPTATGVTITSSVTSSPTSASTSGAHSWRDVRSGVVAGIVVGAVAALI